MMNTSGTTNRRDFIRAGLLATAAGIATTPAAIAAAHSKPSKPWGGLKVGLASYTLRKFSLEETLTITANAGVKYITLKDVHAPMNTTREQREAVRQKVAAAGLTLMGGGVIYLNNNQEEIVRAFDYARDCGMPVIVCSPAPEALDAVEKAVKTYDLPIAIHNHGPGDKRYPSPLDVLELIKHRDTRMGICMDLGHTVRLGQDPVAVMKTCAARLYDFHIKDITAATAKAGATEVGKGVIDMVAVLRELLRTRFSYHVALEYEAAADSPVQGMLESFAYIRGVLAALG